MTSKAPLPSKNDLLTFIQDSPGKVGKREIARAFHVSAADRPALRAMIKELEKDGLIERAHGRRFAEAGSLPEVTVLHMKAIDEDGDVLAHPVNWNEENGPPPRIVMAPERRGKPALGIGDRVLARIKRVGAKTYEGRTIKLLPKTGGPTQIVGVFDTTAGDTRIRSTDRRHKAEMAIPPNMTRNAKDGDLVLVEAIPGRHAGMRQGKVIDVLGSLDSPKAISLIVIHAKEIPFRFTADTLLEAEKAGPAPLGKRVDLRDVPLVTIDGADARDFDDAVFAESDPDPKNPDGWHLIVAIADVSWYVRPGSALDRSAFERGNSVYFPDRVVPMLPEALSNGWCSLNPKEDRPCMAAHLFINKDGRLKDHRFERAMMRSAARLTYEQVQSAMDGAPDDTTGPLVAPILKPLYGAFAALQRDRARRGVLELNMPERQVIINADGAVAGVIDRPRFDSHKLIEDFMITANVAAAEALERRQRPCMYRVHDAPAPEKIESLREFLDSLDLSLPSGRITPHHLNRIIQTVEGTPHARLVNEVILRSQAQAVYSPDNLGHFGLGLRRYAHFTSPIRRYADLLVHRALVSAGDLGDGGLPADPGDYGEIGEHISATERRAMAAEREAVERFTATHLSTKIGETLPGRITGVSRFGLFVALDDTGGEGLVPISSLPDDYYTHEQALHSLVGKRSKRQYQLGDTVTVLLREADPITGSTVMELLEDGAPPARRKGRGKPPRRPTGGKKRRHRR
ncbi:MAG: ribonuclease R [Magnetospiraceae bacterium]